jgi:two-component system CheB/CheR fusion protein
MPAARALSVLVVDDYPDAADTLGGLVELFGHRVHIARSACEAIRIADETLLDVVILDIGLPDEDGYCVAEKLKAFQPRKPLTVVLTGHSRLEGRSFMEGIDKHFIKPLEANVLEELLLCHAEKLEREQSAAPHIRSAEVR